jgi:hypothetical protein
LAPYSGPNLDNKGVAFGKPEVLARDEAGGLTVGSSKQRDGPITDQVETRL